MICGIQLSMSALMADLWARAELEPEAGWAWRRFTFAWKPSQADSYSLSARAFDMQGVTQPSDNARNAIHRVRSRLNNSRLAIVDLTA